MAKQKKTNHMEIHPVPREAIRAVRGEEDFVELLRRELVQSSEESWRECHIHARNLLGERGYLELLGEVLANTPEGGWRDALMFACALSQKGNLLYAVEAALGALSPESWSRRLDEALSIMAERGFTLDPDDWIQLLSGATKGVPEGERQDALKACKALLDRGALREPS